MSTNPEFVFDYDIIRWLDSEETPLVQFKLDMKIKLAFRLTKDQYKIVQDKLEIFGDTPVGMGQVIKRIPRKMIWRNPIIENKILVK